MKSTARNISVSVVIESNLPEEIAMPKAIEFIQGDLKDLNTGRYPLGISHRITTSYTKPGDLLEIGYIEVRYGNAKLETKC